MRENIFTIIEADKDNENTISKIYDIFMIVTVIASLVPLAFKTEPSGFLIIDKITMVIFIIDYILRWITADYKLKKGITSFFLYPISIMAIVDLLSIMPSLMILNNVFRVLRIIRLLKALKVIRALKFLRYSKNVDAVINTLKRQKNYLLVVCGWQLVIS